MPQFIGGLSVRPRQVEGGAPATLAHQPQWQTQSRISTGRYTNHPVGTLINSRIPNALRAAEPTPLNFDVAPQPGISSHTPSERVNGAISHRRNNRPQASGSIPPSRLSESQSQLVYHPPRRNPHEVHPDEKIAPAKRQ